jgi:hypothetical protein
MQLAPLLPGSAAQHPILQTAPTMSALPGDSSASDAPTLADISNPNWSGYNTKMQGVSTWTETRDVDGIKRARTYQGRLPLFDDEVLTVKRLGTFGQANILWNLDYPHRKSIEWLQENAKWWHHQVNPTFKRRLNNWQQVVHLIQALAVVKGKRENEIAEQLDFGTDDLLVPADYPLSFQSRVKFLLNMKTGKYYKMQKEFTQRRRLEIAKKMTGERHQDPPPPPPQRQSATPVIASPEAPPQMTMFNLVSPPPQRNPPVEVPVSRRDGYRRVFWKPLGEMDDGKIDQELKTYAKHTKLADLPEGHELDSLVSKYSLGVEKVVGDKRKRAQLAKMREMVGQNNKDLPAKRKKTSM